MLELYFKAADDLRQKWGGPLITRLDEVASILHNQGFCWSMGRRILRTSGHFSHFLQVSGVVAEAQIGRDLIKAFLDSLGRAGSFRDAASDLRHLLDHLCACGVLPKSERSCPDSPFSRILGRFDAHLRDIHGNTALTRAGYLHGAHRFLQWLSERYGERPLAMLNGRDVLEFITVHASHYPGGSWPNQLCSTTRIFLRFLRWDGIISVGIDRMVPRVLPLTQEAGAALAEYLLRGRPACDVPQIFLRHRSPKGPLNTSHGVSNIVRRYLEIAGIDAPAHGAYLLRHTLASRMVNLHVPIKEIADVLGHASIGTTAIYSKVDVVSLAAVALPFPEGAR